MAKNTTNKKGQGSPAAAMKAVSAPVRTSFIASGFWKRHWIPALLIVLSSVGLYQASGRYGYILDDEMVIWKNAYVQEGLSGIGKIFGSDSFMGYFQRKEGLYKLEGGRYRPLSLVTFAVEVELFGKERAAAEAEQKMADPRKGIVYRGRGIPEISHWINILLYGLNGVLLYAVLLALFPMANRHWWWSIPMVGSLLFMVHPLHTECIANIKGRDEIMALMGSLGALYLAMRYFDSGKSSWMWFSSAVFLLGLLSKENTLTFLAVIPLTIWVFGRVSFGRAILGVWPLFLSAFVFILIRYNALGYMLDHGKGTPDLMNDSFLGMNLGERTATIFLTLLWYLKLLIYPIPLTHDYYPYHVPKVNWTDWRALLSLVLYAGAIAWSVIAIRKRSTVAYSILYFVITLSIVSNLLVSVGSFMNERFAYMPSVGFCLLAAWFLVEKVPALFKNPSFHYAGIVLFLPFAAFLSWRTVNRIPAWENAFALNRSAVIASPNSARAQSFYSTAIYEERYLKAQTNEEKMQWVDTMEVHVKRALEIYPQYGSAWVMYANVAAARFELDKNVSTLLNQWTYALNNAAYVNLLRSNIDAYVKYLAKSGSNAPLINEFAYKTGYELYFKKLKDNKSAQQFLEYAVLTQQLEPATRIALAEVYEASGMTNKAIELRQSTVK